MAEKLAGYSERPLAQKLGIKAGARIVVIDPPANYRKLLGGSGRNMQFAHRAGADLSFIHYFATRRSELEKQLALLRQKLADTGTLWVSWPKKSAGVATDVTEDVIRAVALPLGFVDIKVCAVDETWSGLKLMIRLENRKSASPKR